MRIRRPAIAIILTFSAGLAAGTAQSPKTVTDTRKRCQLTVPGDWTVTVDGATGYAPGKKVSASVNSVVSNRSFADAKTFIKGNYPPVKVIQDDAKRLLYSFDPGIMGAGKSGWYEVVASTPTCAASFMYAPGTDEAGLRKVVDSLGAAKK